MLYRHKDGTYTASSPDGEFSRRMTDKEAEAYVIQAAKSLGFDEDHARKTIKSYEGKEGFIVT